MNVLAKCMSNAAADTAHQGPAWSNPLDRLPAEKRAKLIALEDQKHALHGAIPTDRVSAAYERRETIRAERAKYAEHVAYNGRAPNDAERIASFDQQEADATAEIQRLEKVHNRATDAWNLAGNTLERCIEYLRSTSAPLKAARASSVKLDQGQTYLNAVTTVRAELDKLDLERDTVELAPVPAKELVEQALAALDRVVSKGAPDFDPRIRGRDPLKLDRHLEHPSVGVAFLMFLFRDQIADRLTKMIGTDIRGALTDAERSRRLDKIAADRLDLERKEEALIVAADDVGQHIERRLDADPRAILEIE